MSKTLEKLNLLDQPTRLKLYTSLLQEELSEQELPEVLGVPESELAGHIQSLREADLIESQRHNGETFYQACPNPFEEARELIRRKESHEWFELQERIFSAKQKHRNTSPKSVQNETTDEAFFLNELSSR